MINLKKSSPCLTKLFNNSKVNTSVYIYPSKKTAGDDYDPYEQNYTYTNLRPIVIKGYVSDIKPEALVWKQYGLKEIGAKQILCDSKYAELFRIGNKIVINGDDYVPYKEGLGNKALITSYPYNVIKVVLFKL